MLWFLFARGRKPQCEVKSPRSLCFDKWQKLNSKSFVNLPNITWKIPSLFIYGSRIFSLLESICRINGKNIVKKNLFWCEDCDSRIFFFHKMIKHVDLMIRNVGYFNSLSKDIYVNFLVAVPGTVETAWPPEYFFSVWETLEGQYGLDKLALKKVCLVFFDHRFFWQVVTIERAVQ